MNSPHHPHFTQSHWLLLSVLAIIAMSIAMNTCTIAKSYAQSSSTPAVVVAPSASSQPAVVITPNAMPVYIYPSPGAGQPATIITPGAMPTYVWPGGAR